MRPRWFNAGWIGRRFHITWRIWDYMTGPLGLGFRLYYWAPKPDDWSWNIDLLTPLFDLQFGFHIQSTYVGLRYYPRIPGR